MTADEKKQEENIEIIEAEEVHPIYFNEGLIQPYYKLHRLNTPKGRVYFIFADPANEIDPIFFGGTGSVGKELPTSEGILYDIDKRGRSAANRNYFMRMLFGSFSHSRLAQLCIEGTVHLDALPDMMRKYYHEAHFYVTDKELYDMSREIQRDMISLQQWRHDFEVELVFVEFPVFSHTLKLGTQIDLGCFVTITEGSGKNKTRRRVFTLIDYKSGKSGFYTEHIYQLYSNLQLFTHCYPEFETNNIELYNLAGKKWRSLSWGKLNKDGSVNRVSTPYSFTAQHEKIDFIDYNARLIAAQNHFEQRIAKPFMYIQGDMTLKDDPKQFIIQKTLMDLVREGDWKRFLKSSASIPENITSL